ncbi:hypothetical protein ACQCX2_13450 [Propionibacteriaceae bacterium Y1700]|uniref:hypothetical protein n=1 Tax=Microlunatus sp. Y1700 TaxID=3418487 RepID=UPI003DA79511
MTHWRRQIGPDTVVLEGEGNRTQLRNLDSGESARVGPLEASAFLNSTDQRFAEFFLDRGGLGVEPSSDLASVGIALAHGLPTPDLLACWMDTTTLQNATRLVEGDLAVTPAAMLDLATLVHAVLFHDQIAIDAESAPLPETVEEFVLRQNLRNERGVHQHHGYAVLAASRLQGTSDPWSEVQQSWRDLLGEPVSVDFRLMDERTDSPGRWPYLPGGTFGLGWDPMAAQTDDSSPYGLDVDVSIQTYRYVINEQTAERFGIPYLSTSLRYPVERVSLRHRLAYRTLADRLLNTLLGPPESGPVRDGPYQHPVRLPQPLGVVLAATRHRQEFWQVLFQHRAKYRAVREWIAAHRDEFGGDEAMADLRRLLPDTAPAGALFADTMLAATTGIAGALPSGAATAAVALKAAGTLRPASRAVRLIESIRRPELRLLRSLRSEAQQVATCDQQIHRLWGTRVDADWLARAVRLGEAGALDAARPRP